MGRSEERLSRGGTPVNQQPAAGAVGEAKPSDVHGLGIVPADDASQAQVQTEATQDAQPSGQPVDLHVPVHRLLAYAAGRFALGIEAAGQVGDRLLKALRDGREVQLVAGDQRRVGLGGEVAGKVERAGRQGIHVISSDLRSTQPLRAPGRLDRRTNLVGAERRAEQRIHPPDVQALQHPVSVTPGGNGRPGRGRGGWCSDGRVTGW